MRIEWVRDGQKWLRSACGRYRISRNDLFCDVRYTSYDWYPTVDVLPIVIGTFERKEQALESCRLNHLYGGAP